MGFDQSILPFSSSWSLSLSLSLSLSPSLSLSLSLSLSFFLINGQEKFGDHKWKTENN